MPEIVRALAGDSTTTRLFAFLFVTLSSVTRLCLPGPNVRHRCELAYKALQLQHRQHAAHRRYREAALPAHLIDVHRLSRYMTQQRRLRIGRRHAFFHLDLLRHHRQIQLFQHVLYTCNELGALLDQFIRPAALDGEHAPRHGEHLPVLLQRQTGGDHGAALHVSLNDEYAHAEAGHDPVAPREEFAARLRTRRVVAHQGAPLDYLPRQARVLRRVDDVQPAGHDRDGAAAGVQRRPVGDGVHAPRQAAHHADAVGGQAVGYLLGGLAAVGRRPARPHHRDAPFVARAEPAAGVEGWGEIVYLLQPRRVGGVLPREGRYAATRQPLHLLVRRDRRPLGGDARRQPAVPNPGPPLRDPPPPH